MIDKNFEKNFILTNYNLIPDVFDFDYIYRLYKNDKDVMLNMMKNKVDLYASEGLIEHLNSCDNFLLTDEEFILKAIEINGYIIDYASDEIKTKLLNNKETVMIISKTYDVLEIVNEELKDDKDVVMIACAFYGRNIIYASERLQNDINVVKIAINQYSRHLKELNDKLKDNRDIVEFAIKKNGFALAYASERLKNDKKLIEIAINNCGTQLDGDITFSNYFGYEELKKYGRTKEEFIKSFRKKLNK